MDQLPDELIELILLSSTCQSLGRLSQTSTRYQQIIQPSHFWRTKLHRDYPEMKRYGMNQDSDWLKAYRLAYLWHRKCYRDFPTLIREAEYLVQMKKCTWMNTYLNMSSHPLRVYREIRKICAQLDHVLKYPFDGFPPKSVAWNNLKPHLDLASNQAMYFDLSMRRYDIVFIIPQKLFLQPGSFTLMGPPFLLQHQYSMDQLLIRFREYWVQQNLTATVELIDNPTPSVCLRIHGSLQTQPTGAQIWVPKPSSE